MAHGGVQLCDALLVLAFGQVDVLQLHFGRDVPPRAEVAVEAVRGGVFILARGIEVGAIERVAAAVKHVRDRVRRVAPTQVECMWSGGQSEADVVVHFGL